MKDTGHIFNKLNNSNLPTTSILVEWLNVSWYDNEPGLKLANDILELLADKFSLTSCALEALEPCLSCNNSIFDIKNYLQTAGTASHDSKALAFDLGPITWKTFFDDVFVVWTHGSASLALFLDYINNIDERGKIKFTLQVASNDGLRVFICKTQDG